MAALILAEVERAGAWAEPQGSAPAEPQGNRSGPAAEVEDGGEEHVEEEEDEEDGEEEEDDEDEEDDEEEHVEEGAGEAGAGVAEAAILMTMEVTQMDRASAITMLGLHGGDPHAVINVYFS